MNVIKKAVIMPKFGQKKFMLLGVRNDKQKVYMEQASLDRGWYFGFGYLEVLDHLRTDIREHYHFSSLFEVPNKNGYDAFKEAFPESVLEDKEVWQLVDLMKSFYALKEVSEIYFSGSNHYTSSHGLNLKNEAKYIEALEDQKKVIFAVQKLLGLADEQNEILLG